MTNNHGISRRRFLAQSSAATASAALSLGWRRAHSRQMDNAAQLTSLSAVKAVAALRNGDITAEAYAGALLLQAQSGALLNAFITLRPEAVLEAARDCDRRRRAGQPLGPLHGLPIPIKDSVNTRDLTTTAGTPALRHFQPAADAPTVAILRRAGAIVLGKTNLHELSYGYTRNNHAYGAVRNPYDPTRIRGGNRLPHGTTRNRRRYGRLHPRAGSPVRVGWISAHHRPIFDGRLRPDH